MKWPVVVCGLCACIDIHPYAGPNSGPDGGSPDGGTDGSALGAIGNVNATLTPGGGAVVIGPGYVLHFSDTPPHYPDSYLIAGHEVLASSAVCTDVSKMGVAMWPAMRSDTATDQNDIEISQSGPTVARLVMQWNSPIGACGNVGITSTWEFFPDGRISRMDALGGTGTFDASCGCGQTGFLPRSEMAVDHQWATSLRGVRAMLPTPDSNGGTDDDIVCFNATPFHLIVSDGVGPHGALYDGPNHDVGVVYEQQYEMAGGPTWPALQGFIPIISNYIAKEPGYACSKLLEDATGYIQRVGLSVDGTDEIGDVTDGLQGGFSGTDFGFSVTQDDLVIKLVDGADHATAAPLGTTIGLKMLDIHTAFTISKNGTVLDDQHARVQVFDANPRWVAVWLRDPFTSADTIRVQGR